MRKTMFLTVILMPLFLFSQQIKKQTATNTGEKVGFLEYKPSDYNANTTTRYPIIIFLHGIGERGNGTTELDRVKNISIPHYIDKGNPMKFYKNGKWETFLVLSPQCPMKYGMWPTSYVEALISYAENNLRIDKNRIYLMGLSMGGGGTWKYATESLANAKKLAAIATVCAPPTMTNACNIGAAGLPLWAFHATDDQTVNISSLYNAITQVNGCHPLIPAIKTVFSSGGHGVWDRAFDTEHKYQNPNVFEWLLGYSRNNAQPANQKPVANAGNTLTTDKPETIKLNGSASKDPDGWLVGYAWRKISGPSGGTIPNSTSAVTNVTGIKTAGTYKFELKVTDNKGAFSTATVNVNVAAKADQPSKPGNTKNQTPAANIITSASVINLPANSVTLNGWNSKDKDGWITSYQWTKILGPSGYKIQQVNAAQIKVNGLARGIYKFRLTIKDNKNASAYKEVTITVNAAPVVKAGPDITINWPNTYAFLNGSGTIDPGDWVTSYKWTKISGPNMTMTTSNTSKARLWNLSPGVYKLRLTATDSKGANSSDDVVVTVKGRPSSRVNVSTMAIAQEITDTSSSTAENERLAALASVNANKLNVYPNPASNNININCDVADPGKATVTIYDISGRPVKMIAFEKNQEPINRNIDISSLIKGIYVIDVKVNNMRRSPSGRFIKQ